MKIDYDKTADAKYVTIKKGKVNQTERLCSWLLLDLNSKGDVLGIEILNPAKNLVNIFTDGKEVTFIEYQNIPNAIKFENKPRFESRNTMHSALAHA